MRAADSIFVSNGQADADTTVSPIYSVPDACHDACNSMTGKKATLLRGASRPYASGHDPNSGRS